MKPKPNIKPNMKPHYMPNLRSKIQLCQNPCCFYMFLREFPRNFPIKARSSAGLGFVVDRRLGASTEDEKRLGRSTWGW